MDKKQKDKFERAMRTIPVLDSCSVASEFFEEDVLPYLQNGGVLEKKRDERTIAEYLSYAACRGYVYEVEEAQELFHKLFWDERPLVSDNVKEAVLNSIIRKLCPGNYKCDGPSSEDNTLFQDFYIKDPSFTDRILVENLRGDLMWSFKEERRIRLVKNLRENGESIFWVKTLHGEEIVEICKNAYKKMNGPS